MNGALSSILIRAAFEVELAALNRFKERSERSELSAVKKEKHELELSVAKLQPQRIERSEMSFNSNSA